jgi:hypothetical protein
VHYRHELFFFWRFSRPREGAHYATLNTVCPSPGRQLIFFSMGRRANENLNSIGGRFERNLNLLVVGDLE